MLFPTDYPFAPPFVRVVSPRFAFHKGRVTVGGSICTEVLTPSGWSSTLTVEDLLIALQAEMLAGEPRLDPANQSRYSLSEARAAFDRVAKGQGMVIILNIIITRAPLTVICPTQCLPLERAPPRLPCSRLEVEWPHPPPGAARVFHLMAGSSSGWFDSLSFPQGS